MTGNERTTFGRADTFIGIDGGGSATTGVRIGHDGSIIARAAAGPLNHLSAGIGGARDALVAVLEGLGGPDATAVAIGLSSLNSLAPPDLRDELCDGLLDASITSIHSDVFVALKAVGAVPCALVISGTGSVAASLDANGRFKTAGGWGWLLGDQGSAYDIALKAMKSVLLADEGAGPPTVLSATFHTRYGTSYESICEAFYGQGQSRDVIASFSVEVGRAAEMGDAVAMIILNAAGRELAQFALPLIGNSEARQLGIWGSVLRQNGVVRTAFIESVSERFPDAAIGVPRFAPELGAALWAAERAGYTDTIRLMEHLDRAMSMHEAYKAHANTTGRLEGTTNAVQEIHS